MRLDVPARERETEAAVESLKRKDSDIGMGIPGEHTWEVEASDASREK